MATEDNNMTESLDFVEWFKNEVGDNSEISNFEEFSALLRDYNEDPEDFSDLYERYLDYTYENDVEASTPTWLEPYV